jgi:photosystem II stability/assembly factor-like uncharacterized protein
MHSRLFAMLWFALTLCAVIKLQAQTPVWTQFPNSPSGTTPRFDDISFVNETTGFVARATGGIWKTTDGGQSFTLSRSSIGAYPGTNLTAHFRSIAFASATRGWAGNLGPGSYDAAVTDTNILFETFDGGLNWTNKPGFTQTGMKGLCALHVLDAQNIYGGGRVRGPAYFIKSSNGGTNWSITNLTAAGVMGGIMDVYFKDTTNGFLVGMDTNAYNSCVAPYYHGCIARTTNSGATWKVVAVTALNCCYFWKMSWPSPNVGYASLQQNGAMANHIFYKTTDGGATWVSNGIPFAAIGVSSFYWQGVGFATEQEGWAGGDSGSGTANFLHTTDGGASWTPVGFSDSRRINRIRFLRPDFAVASGAKIYVYRAPLAIVNQPRTQWVSPGMNVTFSVEVSGNPPFAYQWQRDGVNIAGATSSTYSLTNVVRSNSATFRVVVTNATGGTLLSSNAMLRVFTPQLLGNLNLAGGTVSGSFGDGDGGQMDSNYLPFFQVLASTNLANWELLDTPLSVTNGRLLFRDTNAASSRFYRVREH